MNPSPDIAVESEGQLMTARYADLLTAISFAAERHRNQRRKDVDSTPYINHPLQLACLLATDGGVNDVETLIAAVLHDTVEDTQTTNSELVDLFGSTVADIVAQVTDDNSLPKVDRKRRQIEHAPHMSMQAALVKLADKTCNLRDVANHPPRGWSLERKQEYFDWAQAVVYGLPKVNASMLAAFEKAYALRPTE